MSCGRNDDFIIFSKHGCIHRQSKNPIKPLAYRTETAQSNDKQEMHCNYAHKPKTSSCSVPCLRNDIQYSTNCNIKHPSHTYAEYQHCHGHHLCPDDVAEVRACDHGPYFPKTSSFPKPVCHPDRPTVIGLQKIIEHENKECNKCSDVFSNLNSLWEKHSPPRRQDDLLEECRDIGVDCHCDHDAPLECCCRCCTCRGCPTCGLLQDCHPCNYYPRRRAAGTEYDGKCARHPCGCFFVPNVC